MNATASVVVVPRYTPSVQHDSLARHIRRALSSVESICLPAHKHITGGGTELTILSQDGGFDPRITIAVTLDAREAWRKTSCVPQVQVQTQLAQDARFFSLFPPIGDESQVFDARYSVVVGKVITTTFPVFLAAALRFAIASAILLPLLLKTTHGIPSLGKKDTCVLFLQAFAGNFLFSILLLYGLKLTSAAESGIILGTVPVVIGLISYLVSRAQRVIDLEQGNRPVHCYRGCRSDQ